MISPLIIRYRVHKNPYLSIKYLLSLVFNSFGNFDRFVADPQTYAGLLLRPSAIARNKNDDVLVADQGRKRIIVLNGFGAFQYEFGEGILNKPSGIDFDRFGNTWIIDAASSAIFCFAPGGRLLFSQNNMTAADGLDIRHPADLAILPGNKIAVSDTENNRLVIYRILFSE